MTPNPSQRLKNHYLEASKPRSASAGIAKRNQLNLPPKHAINLLGGPVDRYSAVFLGSIVECHRITDDKNEFAAAPCARERLRLPVDRYSVVFCSIAIVECR